MEGRVEQIYCLSMFPGKADAADIGSLMPSGWFCQEGDELPKPISKCTSFKSPPAHQDKAQRDNTVTLVKSGQGCFYQKVVWTS